MFEVGFGTGLNALLALQIAEQHTVKIEFETVEKYPLVKEEYELLNYSNMLDAAYQEMFQQMHTCDWNVEETLTKYFSLKKTAGDIEDIVLAKKFDVVFFDAFAPDIQPNLWTVAVFRKMFDALNMGGVLVTYSAKGQVRRNMQEVGFRVERLAGPLGKREMLRAHKV